MSSHKKKAAKSKSNLDAFTNLFGGLLGTATKNLKGRNAKINKSVNGKKKKK